LAALASNDAVRAAQRFALAEPRDAATLALEARARRLAGDPSGAGARLDELERCVPGSPLGALERAALLEAGGAREGALAALRGAAQRDPEDALLGRALADALQASGFLAEALEAACQAASALMRAGDAGPDDLSRWLLQWPERQRVRSELRRRAETDLRDLDCSFALAVLFDADHLVEEAARTYEQLLARDGEHAWAMVYLANLRAGADRGRCAECERAFARAPDLVDRPRSARLLARAVRADQGRDPDLLRTLVHVARDHGLSSEVCAALDEILAGDLPLAQRARLADARSVLGRAVPR
jgi:tetratricopeptide (TPR) repeat protein